MRSFRRVILALSATVGFIFSASAQEPSVAGPPAILPADTVVAGAASEPVRRLEDRLALELELGYPFAARLQWPFAIDGRHYFTAELDAAGFLTPFVVTDAVGGGMRTVFELMPNGCQSGRRSAGPTD